MRHVILFENFSKSIYEEIATKEVDPTKFENPGSIGDESFFKKGLKDGSIFDDIVETREYDIPAKFLKPSQNAIYLGKALGLAIDGTEGGDLGILVSRDNRIIDGHHRWLATLFNNPLSKIKVHKADMGIGDLIPVLRQMGDVLGNGRGSIPSGGDVNIFDSTMKDVEDCIFRGKNMSDKFYNTQKASSWYKNNRNNNLRIHLGVLYKRQNR